MTDLITRRRRWISYAACIWAVLFAAPHAWWALGIPAGFPGGETNHRLWMTSSWRYMYNVSVIFLSLLAGLVALAPLRPSHRVIRPGTWPAAAWIAGGILTLRGVAGLVVDGTSDPVWWPTFLVGGLLFCAVAWPARGAGRPAGRPSGGSAAR